jgi:hypothetical protein
MMKLSEACLQLLAAKTTKKKEGWFCEKHFVTNLQ